MQKFVDLYTEAVIEATESQQKMWADTQQQWVDQAKADPEIGGDKFENNLGDAKRAIKQFGTPELDEAMAVTGAGNHPEFIRFMSRVGKRYRRIRWCQVGQLLGQKHRKKFSTPV